MDGPVSVLVWLANHASNRGVGLEKGQLCNTGMCAPVFWVNPGDRAVADFGELGTVEVEVGTYLTNNDAGAN
jgi:2-keto-4-pentenoate hydratase